MQTPIPLEPDPNLPDWSYWPDMRTVSYRLNQHGFSIVHGMSEFPGNITLAAEPNEDEGTIDQFILKERNRGATLYFVVLCDVHGALIEARLEGDETCWLRSDSIDVTKLLGEG